MNQATLQRRPLVKQILAGADARGLWLAADFDRILTEDQGKTPADALLAQRLGAMDFKKVAPSGP